MLQVVRQFVGYGFNMPQVGSLIDPPIDIGRQLIAEGLAVVYEDKIMPLPEKLEKKKRSQS